jgi:Family of unknown function (DUF6272)
MKENSLANEKIWQQNKSPETYTDMVVLSGFFSLPVVSSTIRIVEEKMTNAGIALSLISKTKLILVEVLENIIKHQDDSYRQNPFVKLYVTEEGIEILAGNQIDSTTAALLQQRIDKLDNLSGEEIQEFYMQQLAGGSLSEQGNAGLGLITIYKRSNKNVKSKISKIDDNHSYFTLEVKAIV